MPTDAPVVPGRDDPASTCPRWPARSASGCTRAGLPVTAERAAAFAHALALVRPVSRRRLYWTARGGVRLRPVAGARRSTPCSRGVRSGGRSRTAADRPGRRRRTGPTPAIAGPAAGGARCSPAAAARPLRRGDRRRRRGRPRDGRPRAPGAARAQRRGGPPREALRRALPARARPALTADDAPAGGDAAATDAPRRALPPRPANRSAAHAAAEHAHRRGPGQPAPPPPAGGPAADRAAVRHLRLDGALRPRVPAVPDLRGARGARTPRRSCSRRG